MRSTIGIALCLAAVAFAIPALRAAADDNQTGNPLEKYRYPKAEATGGSSQGGNMYCERLTTPDSFEKVNNFYHKKLGSGLPPELKHDTIYTTTGGQAVMDYVGKGSAAMRIWIDQTETHSLTVVVSRTKDEKLTHIAISYWKRK